MVDHFQRDHWKLYTFMGIKVCSTLIVVLVLLLIIAIDCNIIYKELSSLGKWRSKFPDWHVCFCFFFPISANLIKFSLHFPCKESVIISRSMILKHTRGKMTHLGFPERFDKFTQVTLSTIWDHFYFQHLFTVTDNIPSWTEWFTLSPDSNCHYKNCQANSESTCTMGRLKLLTTLKKA